MSSLMAPGAVSVSLVILQLHSLPMMFFSPSSTNMPDSAHWYRTSAPEAAYEPPFGRHFPPAGLAMSSAKAVVAALMRHMRVSAARTRMGRPFWLQSKDVLPDRRVLLAC